MEFHLKHENISSATVKLFACSNCDFRSHLFNIIGNSWAMDFLGVIGIFNSDKSELFITHLTRDEFQNYKSIDDFSLTICNRLKNFLNRENLTLLWKSKDENNKLFIKCSKCESKMKEVSEQTLEDYVESGGTIYTIGTYHNN